MLCKILGALLILGSGAALARVIEQTRTRERAKVAAALALVGELRRGIASYRLPLPDILARCDPAILAALGATEPLPLGELLSMASLPGEGGTVLAGFSRAIGHGNADEQLRACDDALARLGRLAKALDDAAPGKEKVTRAVCLGGAAICVILFI